MEEEGWRGRGRGRERERKREGERIDYEREDACVARG